MSADFAPAAHSVGVVGSGAVGQAVATALVAAGFCEQLIIASRTLEQATSMAADLDDMRLTVGSPACPHAATTAGLQGCQVVVVVVAARARFTNTNGTDIRMGGVAANGRIIIELALALRGFGGVVVMVTNPVDVMSRLFAEVSGIRRVVGIGSMVGHGDNGSVRALSPTEGLAYRTEPGSARILIVGANEVNTAAARMAREAVRTVLHREGWTLLHASAVVRDGRAVLTFGSKGAGKTTTALLLARHSGWELLANDRIFVRAGPSGVQILPWPAAAAIGLGLLEALGLYDLSRDRVRAGEHLHPTQDERVTAALRAGHRTPLRDPDGRELKTQVFPHQLQSWFAVTLGHDIAANIEMLGKIVSSV